MAISPSYFRFCANWRVWIKDRVVHPDATQFWPQCLAVDSMSRSELLELQKSRIDNLLQHAVEHVPFYRNWAKARGWKHGDTLHVSDLPVVTKAEYRSDPEAFQADNFQKEQLVTFKTSGSSGEPFQFRQHRRAMDYSYCCLWRSLSRHGLRPGDRRVYIWGRSAIFNKSPGEIRRIYRRNKVRNWLNSTLGIDAYELSEQNVQEAIDQIDAFQPVYLHGYVSALYTIARRMAAEGRRFRDFRLKAVITESEKVYPFQKQTMEEAFGCGIFEHYGSVEMGNIAQTDPQGLLRINDDLFVYETLPTGEAVVTNLLSHAYPFIRYKLGDITQLRADNCGPLPYTVIDNVVGRTVDLIPLKRGGYVHGVALAHVIDAHLRHVLKYQIHQLTLDHFKVRLILREPLPETAAHRIIQDMQSLLGADIQVEIEGVDHIAPAASGKFRWVLSDVSDVAQHALAEQVASAPHA